MERLNSGVVILVPNSVDFVPSSAVEVFRNQKSFQLVFEALSFIVDLPINVLENHGFRDILNYPSLNLVVDVQRPKQVQHSEGRLFEHV